MDLRKYFDLIRQWLWLILVAVGLAGAGTYFVSSRTPALYQSAPAIVLVEGGVGEQTYSDTLVARFNIQTYIELIRTDMVMSRAAEMLGNRYNTDQLKRKVSVSSHSDARIIYVSAVDGDPEIAASIANIVAQAFILDSAERESSRYGEGINQYEQELDNLRDQRQELQTQINSFGLAESAEGEALLSRLEAQLNEIEVNHTQIFNNLQELRVDQAKEASVIEVIEQAQAGPKISPRTRNSVILAVFLGLLAALGLIFFIDFLDDTVNSPDEVMHNTGLATLGVIGHIRLNQSSTDTLVTFNSPRDPVSEAYRVLRTNLSFANVDENVAALLITSSAPGEGKSTTSGNLAVALAQTGKRVILVDADLRRPTQHNLFELSNNHGLTTALLDHETPLEHHIQSTKVSSLRILCSGPIPPNPAELLNSQRMGAVIEKLREEADYVIFDTPPALTVADATILARQMDGCLLVINAGETRREALQRASEALLKTGAVVLGVALNRKSATRGRYQYEYDRYYHYEIDEQSNGRFARVPNWLSGLANRLF